MVLLLQNQIIRRKECALVCLVVHNMLAIRSAGIGSVVLRQLIEERVREPASQASEPEASIETHFASFRCLAELLEEAASCRAKLSED